MQNLNCSLFEKSLNLYLMNVEDQIKEYISIQAEPKQAEMEELHKLILRIAPQCKLWYEDGKKQ